jgi:Tfp pilus assembly protein PilV
MTLRTLFHPSSRARGVTLIEALVALMVMSFGMVALVGLMSNLRRSGDLGKQRTEALRIAQAELASLRAFSALEVPEAGPTDGATYYADIASADARTTTLDDSNTSYVVTRDVSSFFTGAAAAQAQSVRVTVSWQDRATASGDDELQQVVLNSVIARADPAFGAAVSFTPPPGGTRQPGGRHPAIPPAAQDLGDKTSAHRPSGLSGTVWVFNNVTGIITGVCTIDPSTPVTALTPADVEGCRNNTVGYLLSGTVRFSNANPPNPAVPEAAALPLDLAIVAGSYQAPRLNARGLPVKDSAGNIIFDTITTEPPSHHCFDDAPSAPGSGQGFVNYECIVYPDSGTPRTWSGKLVLTQLVTGTTAEQFRVCRYSADYNGNGSPLVTGSWAIDNHEHPAVYAKVTGSLPRQNFLVVRGDRSCPTAPAVDPSAGIFVDHSTAQLQP